MIGKLVFFSTLEQRTYAARDGERSRSSGRIAMGKYSPLIATQSRHYFMSLNGILTGFNAQGTARGTKLLAQEVRRRKRHSEKPRVSATPKR